MRQETGKERKSARLDRRKIQLVVYALLASNVFRGDKEYPKPEKDLVLATSAREASRVLSIDSSNEGADPEEEEPGSEEVHSEGETMTRLKYKRFQGDGN